MSETKNLRVEEAKGGNQAGDVINQHMNKTLYLVELAAVVAIILLMSFTPIGYLKVGVFDITLLSVPVAVGAMVLGVKGGLVCGLAWGLTSFYRGITTGGVMFAINPVGNIVTAIVTRMLVGVLVGLIFQILHDKKATKKVSFVIAGLMCPVLNTILFMSSFVFFFYNTEIIQGQIQTLVEKGHQINNVFGYIVAAVGIQAVVEAVVCCLGASAIAAACYPMLTKAIRKTK